MDRWNDYKIYGLILGGLRDALVVPEWLLRVCWDSKWPGGKLGKDARWPMALEWRCLSEKTVLTFINQASVPCSASDSGIQQLCTFSLNWCQGHSWCVSGLEGEAWVLGCLTNISCLCTGPGVDDCVTGALSLPTKCEDEALDALFAISGEEEEKEARLPSCCSLSVQELALFDPFSKEGRWRGGCVCVCAQTGPV